MDRLLDILANNFFWVAILGIVVVTSLKTAAVGVVRSREREQTKRELAAYVAEGSMTAEEARRIADAGPRNWCGDA